MYLAYSNLRMGNWNPYHGGYYCSCGCHGNYNFPQMWSLHSTEHVSAKQQLFVPFIETLDPSTPIKEIIIGHPTEVPPVLEYMSVDSATEPVISLKIVSAGGTISWADNSITPGYHIKSDIPVVQSESKIIIEIKEVVARLRWGETLYF